MYVSIGCCFIALAVANSKTDISIFENSLKINRKRKSFIKGLADTKGILGPTVIFFIFSRHVEVIIMMTKCGSEGKK